MSPMLTRREFTARMVPHFIFHDDITPFVIEQCAVEYTVNDVDFRPIAYVETASWSRPDLLQATARGDATRWVCCCTVAYQWRYRLESYKLEPQQVCFGKRIAFYMSCELPLRKVESRIMCGLDLIWDDIKVANISQPGNTSIQCTMKVLATGMKTGQECRSNGSRSQRRKNEKGVEGMLVN